MSNNSEKIVLLMQEILANFRYYIHSIRLLDGLFVINENLNSHHPWQNKLSFGLHGVNDSDFCLDSGDKVGSFPDTKLENIEAIQDTVGVIRQTGYTIMVKAIENKRISKLEISV